MSLLVFDDGSGLVARADGDRAKGEFVRFGLHLLSGVQSIEYVHVVPDSFRMTLPLFDSSNLEEHHLSIEHVIKEMAHCHTWSSTFLKLV